MEEAIEILKKYSISVRDKTIFWNDNIKISTYEMTQSELLLVGYKIILPDKLVKI